MDFKHSGGTNNKNLKVKTSNIQIEKSNIKVKTDQPQNSHINENNNLKAEENIKQANVIQKKEIEEHNRLKAENLHTRPKTKWHCSHPKLGVQIDITRWPKETQTHCNHCSFPFAGTPSAICDEINIDLVDMKLDDSFYCSESCALAHILETSNFTTPERMCNTRSWHQKFLGRTEQQNPALPRKYLQAFGGHLTIEQFRQETMHSFFIKHSPSGI